MAKVKGIFYTLGGFFVVMLVVILSLLVVLALQQSNERLKESGALERVYTLDNSLERTIRGIDNGLIINMEYDDSINRTKLSITESLDTNFSNYATDFNTEMQSLANFVESDQPEIEFKTNLVYNSTEKLTIIAEPIDFKYTHLEENGNLILTIYPGLFLPVADFELDLINSSIGSGIEWDTQNPGTDMLFNLTVKDSSGGEETLSEYINSSLLNKFTVNNEIEISIGELCYGCIQLKRNSISLNSTFYTEFLYIGEQITLNYPQGLYTINFSDVQVFLNNGPRIL